MAEKRDTEIRREQIAKAALSVVATKGVRGLSIASVARVVGLVPSALYRHFESKDAILDAVLDLISDRLTDHVTAVTVAHPDALSRLRDLHVRHMELIRSSHAIPRIVFSEEAYNGNRRHRAKVVALVTRYLARVADIIRHGQEQGEIRPELDPAAMATLFLGLIQPPALLWQVSGGTLDLTTHSDETWRVFSGAIRQP
jgi:AcrR family transcriptional regulator